MEAHTRVEVHTSDKQFVVLMARPGTGVLHLSGHRMFLLDIHDTEHTFNFRHVVRIIETNVPASPEEGVAHA